VSSIPIAAVSADIYEDAHLYVNFQTGAVELDGKALRMPNKEFELLAYLVRHARELVTREALLMMIWGYGEGVRTRTLDVHIRRLRQSLEPYGKIYIETVFAVGYRLQPMARKRAEPTVVASSRLWNHSA
jgi:two-component system, OmpR family, alkaline phosphatase synthesis response regulator PhoP